MSFNHSMKQHSKQQQELVRIREREEQIRKVEEKKRQEKELKEELKEDD